MHGANVTHLHTRSPHDSSPRDARVIRAFSTALLRCPPKPAGITSCVAWLQEPAAELSTRQMALRSLESLRNSLFVAPGRDAEMHLLWREALVTACYARILAREAGLDSPLHTGVGLLHRVGEIAALRALAQAERETGERIAGPVMQEIFEAGDDELASRVTRGWSLPGEWRLAIIRWREEQDSLRRPEGVTLLMMAQALTMELVHAATSAPGLAEVAAEALHLPARMLEQARTGTAGIASLLASLAPQPA
jgi:HD-like signal output (HDOD) protein